MVAAKDGLLQLDDFYPVMINERVRVGAKPWVRSRAMSSDRTVRGMDIAPVNPSIAII